MKRDRAVWISVIAYMLTSILVLASLGCCLPECGQPDAPHSPGSLKGGRV